MTAAMELIHELIRVLYHLDIFRRQVRNGASINLHGIKELFSTLSDAMRNPSIQPQTLTKILQGSKLAHELKDKCKADAYNFVASSLLQSDFNIFSTNYSLTKVCLSCSTCSHEDNVIKYIHHIDSTLLSTIEFPSFEFSLKTSLNTNEFCQRINCFGELKIFRVLKQEPTILTLDFESGTAVNILPKILKPYLVFNSTTSSELQLTSVLLSNPSATLFYHTRLFTWIYTNNDIIIPLNTNDWNQVIKEPLLDTSSVVLAFYTYSPPQQQSPKAMPAVPVHQQDSTYSNARMPLLPNIYQDSNNAQINATTNVLPMRQINTTTAHTNKTAPVMNLLPASFTTNNTQITPPIPIVCQAIVHPEPPSMSVSLPIPPILNLKRHGLTYSTSRCSNSSSIGTTTSRTSSLTLPTSPLSTTSPNPFLHERIYENWPLDNDSGHGSIEPNNSMEDGSNSSCSASSRSSNSSCSRSTAISYNNNKSKSKGTKNLRFNMKPSLIPSSSCPTTGIINNTTNALISPIEEPMSPTTVHSMKSTTASIVPMNYATIKRRRRHKLSNGLTSVSVPDLTLDFKKVVSFNCKVTLVDDCNDEEYIPHPIFEKVLEKLRNKQS